ncbi:HTH domain-containing protein [Nitrosomonas halophila]|uniref:HB1, ASXL, restriction endonuclease HTH domain n=1 Tax=Nitrosomonas halophila TaxID=44576 RepID=A0A1H3Q4N9_9PROT|nr:HTH domain-containing protein [Nitrosomonas halophila]SDZ08213.1 HB1, ASXL, restriction endonuclease HTH domain [Nitrosomonas halophila]
MSFELTWRRAIDKVLGSSAMPLHYNEITERIISDGLRKNLGATPAATVNAQISASIKHDGDSSPYIRVAKGIFSMRARASEVSILVPKLTPDVTESEESEEQYEIVTSFGMFWRKEAIEWTATPKLLGMQQIGATPVDFCKQLGIYLLYDGREVIYVGRTTDRPLGRRLYEHTIDRMSARWDRFSWFGLLPISDTGQIGVLPDAYVAAKLIPALEAILIEALEPRQNRKRGDDLAAVEYLQKVDPEIEKRKVKATLDAALNKL